MTAVWITGYCYVCRQDYFVSINYLQIGVGNIFHKIQSRYTVFYWTYQFFLPPVSTLHWILLIMIWEWWYHQQHFVKKKSRSTQKLTESLKITPDEQQGQALDKVHTVEHHSLLSLHGTLISWVAQRIWERNDWKRGLSQLLRSRALENRKRVKFTRSGCSYLPEVIMLVI